MTAKTKRIFFEAAGILLALAGAFLFVAAILPLINPGFAESQGGDTSFLSTRNIVRLAVALGLLFFAFLLSRKAEHVV